MEGVRRLREKVLKNGGSQADFESLGRGYLELGDTEQQDGSSRPNEARTLALKCFQEGALIQMACYDGRGRSQGEAIVIFEKWIDRQELLFRCQHLIASNEYYEWWSRHEADFSRLAFFMFVAGLEIDVEWKLQRGLRRSIWQNGRWPAHRP